MNLTMNTSTPLDYWVNLPIEKLADYYGIYTDLVEEQSDQMKAEVEGNGS